VAVPAEETVTSETDGKMVASAPGRIAARPVLTTSRLPPDETTPVFCDPPTYASSVVTWFRVERSTYPACSQHGDIDRV